MQFQVLKNSNPGDNTFLQFYEWYSLSVIKFFFMFYISRQTLQTFIISVFVFFCIRPTIVHLYVIRFSGDVVGCDYLVKDFVLTLNPQIIYSKIRRLVNAEKLFELQIRTDLA